MSRLVNLMNQRESFQGMGMQDPKGISPQPSFTHANPFQQVVNLQTPIENKGYFNMMLGPRQTPGADELKQKMQISLLPQM